MTPTIWAAPCQQCGADVLTDQYLGAPYFDACECGGLADATRAAESDEPHPATYETPRR